MDLSGRRLIYNGIAIEAQWVTMASISSQELAALLDRHGATLELFARSWCDTPADAVQEAFVELARLPRPPDQLVAWLYGAVRNRALTAGRAARRRQRHEANAGQQRPYWFEADSTSSLDAADVAERLAKLPDVEREVIVAHLWGGLTFEQIAIVTGGSSSGVHRKYQSGLTRLRAMLAVAATSSGIKSNSALPSTQSSIEG